MNNVPVKTAKHRHLHEDAMLIMVAWKIETVRVLGNERKES